MNLKKVMEGSMEIRDTSIEAYDSVQEYIPTIIQRIYKILLKTSPKTCDELEMILGMKHQTVSASLRKLFKLGLIKDIGERRLTRSGRKAIVWHCSIKL